MKVLNLIWGFSLGAGIDKCFLTYHGLSAEDSSVEVLSVCINLKNLDSHIEPLREIGAVIIDINSRKDFSWIGKLHSLILKERPDLVFTHGFNGAIMMGIMRMFGRCHVPVVCSNHGRYTGPTPFRRLVEPMVNRLMYITYQTVAVSVICVDGSGREEVLSGGVPPDKITVVHNGIPDRTPAVAHNAVPEIITASRISVDKGLNHLLQALEIIKDKGIPFRYRMIGEGPELNNMKQLAGQLQLTDCVQFEGFRSDVPECLDQADIFALPSLREYHSIAVLEAMRAAKAIVATNVGGNCESVTDECQGLIVPPADSEALAAAIERLLSDSALRRTLGDAARRRFVDEFTESAMKRGIINALKKAVGK